MARKQTLIHLHGTGRLENAALLNKGEIAVRHAETKVDTELAVKTKVGEEDVLVYIPSFDKVQSVTNAAKSAAETTAKGYADAAQEAAKGYTDAAKNALQGQINALVTGDTSVGKQIEAALETAQGYAEAAQSAAEATAKGYADAAQEAAKGYTDAAVSGAKTELQTAIDEKVAKSDYNTKVAELTEAISDEATARDTEDKRLVQVIADEKAAREAAISGVNSTITTLETSLKAYADQAEADAKTYTDDKIATEVTRSNKYADDAVADEKAAREAAISGVNSTITTLETSLKAYADQAEADAKTYTDDKIATEVVKVNNALTAHTDNDTVHITANERTLWTEAATGFNTFMDGEGLDETLDQLKEIQAWIKGDGVNATELTTAIAVETKNREDADTALGQRIDALISGNTSVGKQIADALAEAKEYTDDAKDAAEETAKNYTDAEIDKVKGTINDMDAAYKLADTNLETALKAYANQAEADAITASTAYTDAREVEIEKAYKAYADTAEADAKKYTDEVVSGATSSLQAAINEKVAKSDYNTKMTALDAEDARLAGLISGNTTAINKEIKDRGDADTAIRGEFAAADNVVRGEFAAADNVVRGEFAAADTQIRTDFAAADTVLSNRIKAIEDATIVTNVAVTGVTGVSVNTLTNGADGVATIDFSDMVIDCGEY